MVVEPQTTSSLKQEKSALGDLSEDKVLVKFWPDEYALMGRSTVVLDLEDAAEKLAESGFMAPWVAQKIREALRAGELFQNVKRVTASWKGRPDGVKAEYRMASKDEVVNFAETQRSPEVSGHTISKRAQETAYRIHYLESDHLRQKYDVLPKQARAIMDILNESGRELVTEAAIEVLLGQGKLNTSQVPIKVFGFYRSRFLEEGHLEVAQ